MSAFTMKLPDVGEGVAEAELVEWLVAVGDEITPDSPLVEVLTDKATVEVSSPVTGVVSALHGEPGDVLAVGSPLIEIETADAETADAEPPPAQLEAPVASASGEPAPKSESPAPTASPPPESAAAPEPRGGTRGRAKAAPAVRRRAEQLGVDLASIRGSGPDGRVVHADLDRSVAGSGTSPALREASAEGRTESVRGVRRRIAERLTEAWTEIPHITYVDAIDASAIEQLRGELNRRGEERGAARLTMLPFLVRALVLACRDQPRLNAHYDHVGQTLTTFDAVHVGVATQTDTGLMVPVVRHAEALAIRQLADEIGRVTEAARTGSATREELAGSTITITSLGALGGLATTPILNPPEVAIVGVNKLETRPVWNGSMFEPRRVFNLSSSFDHRMVDGWDAATFVQRVKSFLETPTLLYVDD